MEKTAQHGSHVVVMPYPIQGHINPFIQFAKRLASKGVRVTVAATTYTVSAISAPGVAVEPISDGFDRCPLGEPGFDVDLYTKTFESAGSETLTRLIQKFGSTESPVDCLVYDSFLPWGQEVAERTGLIAAAFFTHNVTACSALANAHKGLIPLPVDPAAAPFRIRGLPPLNFDDLPSFITRQRLSHPAFTAILMGQFRTYEKADLLFVNSFHGLETQENGSGDLEIFPGKMVGPLVPSAYIDGRIKDDKSYGSSLLKPLSKECMEWLDTRPDKSVVFVSFGSIVSIQEKQVVELAAGLKQSGLNFLWVLRDPELVKLADGCLESTREKGLIVPWCSQLEVLAHRAMGCFLTHCGWNSTLEALSLGVPLVGMPQWSDQPCVARYIEEVWKLGFRAKEDGDEGVVKRDEIARCLKEVMEGERAGEIRENSKKWRELATKALAEGGTSDKYIDEFVQSLRSA